MVGAKTPICFQFFNTVVLLFSQRSNGEKKPQDGSCWGGDKPNPVTLWGIKPQLFFINFSFLAHITA
jgi:hypothetical protein